MSNSNKNISDFLYELNKIGLKVINKDKLYNLEYFNTREKVDCYIFDDNKVSSYKGFLNAIVVTDLFSLKQGRCPMVVSSKNKYSLHNINIYLKNNDLKCEVLSDEYINKKSIMKFKCNCGEEFYTRWNTLRNTGKVTCDLCGTKKRGISKAKTSIEKYGSFKDLLISQHGDDWVKVWNNDKNTVDPSCISCTSDKKVWLNCLDKDYHIYEISCNTYRQGIRCGYCCGKKVHKYDSLEHMNPEISQYWSNKNEVSADQIYFGTSKKYWFKCPNGKHEDNYKQVRELLRGKCICTECYLESLGGENSSNWKGGITSLNMFLRGSIESWKRDTMRRYNYCCDVTGVERNFQIHHLTGFGKIVDNFIKEYNIDVKVNIGEYTKEELSYLRNTFEEYHNSYGLGVLMHKDVHTLFHNIYGKDDGDNTPEQYYEFKNKYINKEIPNCF